MCWPDSRQVGALTDVIAQGLGGVVGLEDGRQQAVLVQSLNPLAIAFVGFGPALDLASELWWRHDHGEAGFDQGEEQDVGVGTRGFQGHGGDSALSQPVHDLPQSGCVRGELTDGIAAVRRCFDADPMAGVANVDAGGMVVLDGQRDQFGALVGLSSLLFGVLCGAA